MREYIRQTRTATGNISQDGDARTVLYRFSQADYCTRRKRVMATQQPPKSCMDHLSVCDDRNRLVRKTVSGGMMRHACCRLPLYTDGRLSRMADSDSTSYAALQDEKGAGYPETTSTSSGHARPVVWGGIQRELYRGYGESSPQQEHERSVYTTSIPIILDDPPRGRSPAGSSNGVPCRLVLPGREAAFLPTSLSGRAGEVSGRPDLSHSPAPASSHPIP